MVSATNEALFFKMLETMVKGELDRVAEQIIEDACQKLRSDMRAKLGQIALHILSEYTVYRMGQDLHITVKLQGGDDEPKP